MYRIEYITIDFWLVSLPIFQWPLMIDLDSDWINGFRHCECCLSSTKPISGWDGGSAESAQWPSCHLKAPLLRDDLNLCWTKAQLSLAIVIIPLSLSDRWHCGISVFKSGHLSYPIYFPIWWKVLGPVKFILHFEYWFFTFFFSSSPPPLLWIGLVMFSLVLGTHFDTAMLVCLIKSGLA